MSYDLMRHVADSWGLLFLTLLFVIACWLALRPAARRAQAEAKMIPLDDEEPRHD